MYGLAKGYNNLALYGTCADVSPEWLWSGAQDALQRVPNASTRPSLGSSFARQGFIADAKGVDDWGGKLPRSRLDQGLLPHMTVIPGCWLLFGRPASIVDSNGTDGRDGSPTNRFP